MPARERQVPAGETKLTGSARRCLRAVFDCRQKGGKGPSAPARLAAVLFFSSRRTRRSALSLLHLGFL
jgi:hypothetical protein